MFRKKRQEREWKRKNPWLQKVKRTLQFFGALFLLAALFLFLRAQAIGTATVFLLVGFFLVAVTVPEEDKKKS